MGLTRTVSPTYLLGTRLPYHSQPPLLTPAPPATDASTSTAVVVREESGPSRPLRIRRNPTQVLRDGKSNIITAPFPWATSNRATVHTLDYLLSHRLLTITGDVQCKRCERQYQMNFDLEEKFAEVANYIVANKITMHDRAPSIWMNPILPDCQHCNQTSCAKPIISEHKRSINWLFLLLGQMLGCCTLDQLKYFCKHTENHRTGAKDRVLYLTYLGLCKQLNPNGPFER
ncbi:hypothetical protein HHK36_008504 [Tetracentron sinense]|uniref:DUF7086 domain-containing protein n=1 Tax=Tetracentron sinense TaxID=13715 RepID=A0A834ZQA4_TETSI|nr:hypothetical protein HHK36_008504 [Tetracentron sinense]